MTGQSADPDSSPIETLQLWTRGVEVSNLLLTYESRSNIADPIILEGNYQWIEHSEQSQCSNLYPIPEIERK